MSQIGITQHCTHKMLESLRGLNMHIGLYGAGVRGMMQTFSRAAEAKADGYESGGKALTPKEIDVRDGWIYLTYEEAVWENLKGQVSGFCIYDYNDKKVYFSQNFDEKCSIPGSRFRIKFGVGPAAPFALKAVS